jgi:hypothetical protein
MVRVRTSLAAGTVALALAGCGSGGPRTVAQTSPFVAHVICDAAAGPDGLSVLRRAASSVAVVEATGAGSVRSQAGIPITIARLRVLLVVSGRRLPASIALRQTGSVATVPGGTCAPIVTSGHSYLAFLTPFRLRPHGRQIGDQFEIAGGGIGLYASSEPGRPASSTVFERVVKDPGLPIPARLTIADVRHG